MFIGGPLFSVGLFWFGWTSVRPFPSRYQRSCSRTFAGQALDPPYPLRPRNRLQHLLHLPRLPDLPGRLLPMSAPPSSLPLAALTSHADYAASAFAAAQIVRSLAGFGFPLFAGPMIHELGVPWTASLLGFVGLVLSPIPFLFYKCVLVFGRGWGLMWRTGTGRGFGR